jgi:CHASE3 domain sensor protein
MTTFRRRVHSRSLRTFLIAMIAVPLVSLLALWGFAASITVSAAVEDQAYNASSETTNTGVYGLVSELPQERAQTYVWLLSGQRAPRAPVLAARKLVDKAIPQARAAFVSVESSGSPVLTALLTEMPGTASRSRSVNQPTAARQRSSGCHSA